MNTTVATVAPPRHLSRLENLQPVQAKADLKNLEPDWKPLVGKAIARMLALANISQKEAAALLVRDVAQVNRWVAGTERPQLDVMFAVACLRQPLVLALAEMAGEGVEVTTTIRIRRTA